MKATLIDTMGDDLKVVNAARASFSSKSTWESHLCDEINHGIKKLRDKDAKLIRYLARGMPAAELDEIIDSLYTGEDFPLHRDVIRQKLNDYRGTATHWVPFAHCMLTFEIEMPIFVARQLIRHTVGVSISEMSRRYVDEDPEYWYPAEGGWRMAAANVKQGSSDEVLGMLDDSSASFEVHQFCEAATKLYRYLVDEKKVAPELARIILPQNTYTSWTWTVSLVTAARVCHQRLDPHAQKEIQVLAQQIYDAAMQEFPVAFKALMDFGAE